MTDITELNIKLSHGTSLAERRATPGPGRWSATGGSFENLTLTPSINLSGNGCGWHGFVTIGEITP